MLTSPISHTHQRAFTLVELMIVVSIIAVLAAIAYPSYTTSVRKTARAEAQGELANAAMAMERLKAQTFSYAGATVGTTFSRYSPESATSAATAKYQLSFAVGQPTASTFEIIATPLGDQRKGDNGVMKINHLGQRCWSTDPLASDCVYGSDKSW